MEVEGRELRVGRGGDVTRFGIRKDAGRNAMPLDPCSNVLEQTTHPLTIIYPLSKFRVSYRYLEAHLSIMHASLPSSKQSGDFRAPLGVPFHSTCTPHNSVEVGMRLAAKRENT